MHSVSSQTIALKLFNVIRLVRLPKQSILCDRKRAHNASRRSIPINGMGNSSPHHLACFILIPFLVSLEIRVTESVDVAASTAAHCKGHLLRKSGSGGTRINLPTLIFVPASHDNRGTQPALVRITHGLDQLSCAANPM